IGAAAALVGSIDEAGQPDHRSVGWRMRTASGPAPMSAGVVRLGRRALPRAGRRRAVGASEPLAVVDWQAVRGGQGVADLAYFAMSSLQPHHRRAWERQLVESYHAALVEHGVPGYDLARCVADYRLARFWSLHTLERRA